MSAYAKTLMRVMLDCNHTVEIPVPIPAIGDEQYCRRCNDWKLVTDHLLNYYVRCLGRHSYSRTFGADKDRAFLAARKHVLDNPRHTVQIGCNGRRLCEVDNVSETMFATPDELRKISHDAQLILKGLTQADDS